MAFDDLFPEAPDVRKGMRGLLPEVNNRTSEVLHLLAEVDGFLGGEADFRAESADFEAEEVDLLGEPGRPPSGGG
ncbi:hypothetical protein [Polyangium fumosum]|uniref:Uncharacterized protein n=1 Tax=Polyangium fumosum TaxID=889272 RepID=A0A4U1JC01_9BACT|nr:hypothetical protein [Polyangium fumosum]TKD05165.1 hypothetical protein E8A74_21735 [Polyangium fumosum]